MSGHEGSSGVACTHAKDIARLERKLGVLSEELVQLRAENKRLRRESKKQQDRIRDLEAKLDLNSQNSSLPPSSDLPWTAPKREPKKRTGRKPGGQPGHDPHQRILVPEDQLAEFYDVRPPNCIKCGKKLRGDDPAPFRHQVFDVPPESKPFITEHRLHSLECLCCGTVTKATPHSPHRSLAKPRSNKPQSR